MSVLQQLDHTAKLNRIKYNVEALTGCRNASEVKVALKECGIVLPCQDFRLKSTWLHVLWLDASVLVRVRMVSVRIRAVAESKVQPLYFAQQTKDVYQHRLRDPKNNILFMPRYAPV